MIGAALLLAFIGVLYFTQPAVEELRTLHLSQPLQILTQEGKRIAQIGNFKRSPLTWEEIPPDFVSAILAAEDQRFFSHFGVDIYSLARAVRELILRAPRQSGASTITMQVARNYYLSRERTLWRKLNEILLALKIERVLSKQEIFELYVNKIFLGFRSYGVAAAAQTYYNQPLAALTLPQYAMLAALPKAPSALNPIANPQRALARRNWVLGRMRQLGYLTAEQHQKSIATPLTARPYDQQPQVSAGYVAEMVRLELLANSTNYFGTAIDPETLYTAGYRVYTTIEEKLQYAANRAVVSGVLAYEQRHGFRGVERHHTALATPADFAFNNPALQQAMHELERTSSFGVLEPVIVSRVDEAAIETINAHGERVVVSWEGLQWARPFIEVNHRGKQPQSAADIVRVGDQVRIYFDIEKSRWQLAQVPEIQASLVAMRPDNGAIVALVGGFHFTHSAFNRAVQAQRQMGSTIKPFLYTAAFEQGRHGATMINDAPFVGKLESNDIWRPGNANDRFEGLTVLREGLYRSRNLVSVHLLNQLSLRKTMDTIARFGFDRNQLPPDLSLALGSAQASPLQVARGFSAFANGGFLIDPHWIARIEDARGRMIYTATPRIAIKQPYQEMDTRLTIDFASANNHAPTVSFSNAAPRVIDPKIHFMIHDILQDVIRYGTGKRAGVLERDDLAGKTGTTNNILDAWFSGYNPSLVAVSWMGFDHPTPLGRSEYGAVAALPMWIDFMRTALGKSVDIVFPLAEGLRQLWIDRSTGDITRENHPQAYLEYLRAEDIAQLALGFNHQTDAEPAVLDILDILESEQPLSEEKWMPQRPEDIIF